MKTPPWMDRSIAANAQTVQHNFANWFGRSKVLDQELLPLVVYHGANADVQAFDPARTGQNFHYAKVGFFFSHDPDAAASYALSIAGAFMGSPGIPGLFKGTPADCGNGSAHVIAVHLRIERPLEVKLRGNRSPEQWFDYKCEELYEKSRKQSADGIIVRAPVGSGFEHRTLYVAFEPCQVKSALGNSGLYAVDGASLSDASEALQLGLASRAKAAISRASQPAHVFDLERAAKRNSSHHQKAQA